MGLFGGCYQSGDFQDEENSYLNSLILENEQEKLVPKEMTLNDLLFYPMENSNKNPKDKILYPNNSLKNLIYVHIIRFSPIAKVIIIPEVNTILMNAINGNIMIKR